MTDNKTVLQALALINDYNKYKMDLTTNGVVITDAIKFVQSNKEKLFRLQKKKIKNLMNRIMMKTKYQLRGRTRRGNTRTRNN